MVPSPSAPSSKGEVLGGEVERWSHAVSETSPACQAVMEPQDRLQWVCSAEPGVSELVTSWFCGETKC